MNKNKFYKKLTSGIFYFSILLFIIAFNFSDNGGGGWTQQFLPNLSNRPLSDMQFIDSLLGYGITGNNVTLDTNYILKTTNGGENWFIINTIYKDLKKVQFINAETGYVCGGGNGKYFIKTTNGGINWNSVINPEFGYIDDIYVLNEDTIWYTEQRTVVGGLFRTTDAGATWVRQFYENGNIPSRIYMINSQVGYFSGSDVSILNKTTNSGLNWTVVPNQNGFRDIYFADSLIGWKATGAIKKTTDGGVSWVEQILPLTSTTGILEFSFINKDTIWGVGGSVYHPGHSEWGVIYRTTNGGINWGYQLPDTNFNIPVFYYTDFLNNLTGWSYFNFIGVHTLTGGDTITYYTGIINNNTNVPDVFTLYQNYPNPFNPKTKINYELKFASYVRFAIYDISGKEIAIIVNKRQNSGNYEISFDGSDMSSGVYFYRLDAEDLNGNIDSKTKKMILLH